MTELRRINPIYPETVKSNFRSIAEGGLTTDYTFLACYADYTFQEYLLGSGPTGTNKLSVAYDRMGEGRSYGLYREAHGMGEFGDEGLWSLGEYEAYLSRIALDVELLLGLILEARESVVFLAPMGAHSAIAFESWQAVAQWDLQTDEDDIVHAVRYGTHENDPGAHADPGQPEDQGYHSGGGGRFRRRPDSQRKRADPVLPGHRGLRGHHAGRRQHGDLHAGPTASGDDLRRGHCGGEPGGEPGPRPRLPGAACGQRRPEGHGQPELGRPVPPFLVGPV